MRLLDVDDVRAIAAELAVARLVLDGDGVLWVTLDPEGSGLTLPECLTELGTLFDCVSLSDEVRVVVVKGPGGGRRFTLTPGGMGDESDPDASPFEQALSRGHMAHRMMRVYNRLLAVDQPVIACVNGDAIQAATSFTQHCDIVLASEDARFGDTHTIFGLNASVGGYVWPLNMGLHAVAEHLFTSELLSAAQAQRLGLVNHVHPEGLVEDEAGRLARRLAGLPQHAIAFTKRVLRRRLAREMVESNGEGVAWELLLMTAGRREMEPGYRALKERKVPGWEYRDRREEAERIVPPPR